MPSANAQLLARLARPELAANGQMACGRRLDIVPGRPKERLARLKLNT
jgi:hypothetical protein